MKHPSGYYSPNYFTFSEGTTSLSFKISAQHLAVLQKINLIKPKMKWLSGNAIVSGALGLRFKSRTGLIGHILPAARHRCDISP